MQAGWELAESEEETSWTVRRAPFGYGTAGLINTKLPFGSDVLNKHSPIYFKKRFYVPEGTYSSLYLRAPMQDGAIVYLNGTEAMVANIYRVDLTPRDTQADRAQRGNYVLENDASLLIPGEINTIAVALYAAEAQFQRAWFDLELQAVREEGAFDPTTVEIPRPKVVQRNATALELSLADLPPTISVLNLEYRESSTDWKTIALPVSERTYILRGGLLPNRTYYLRFKGVNADRDLLISELTQAKTLANPSTPQGHPYEVSIERATDKVVIFNWENHATNAASVEVTRRLAGRIDVGAEITRFRLKGNATRFVDTSVLPSTRYEYSVRVRNSAGLGEGSPGMVVSTLAPGAAPLGIFDGMVAMLTPNNDVELRWHEYFPNEDSFLLERTSPTNGTRTLFELSANSARFIDRGANSPLEADYQYSITAVNQFGESYSTGTGTIQVPATPTEPLIDGFYDEVFTHHEGICYFALETPDQIQRYDTNTREWFPQVLVEGGEITAMLADDEGVLIVQNEGTVSRVLEDGTLEEFITGQRVRGGIWRVGDRVLIAHAGNLLFYDRATGEFIEEVAAEFFGPMGNRIVANRLYGASAGGVATYVEFNADGSFLRQVVATNGLPFRGERQVYLSKQDVVLGGDIWSGDLSERIPDPIPNRLAVDSTGERIVTLPSNSEAVLLDRDFNYLGHKVFSFGADEVHVVGNEALLFDFQHPNPPVVVPLEEFDLPGGAEPMSYTVPSGIIEQVTIHEGIAYLITEVEAAVFRWNLKTGTFLPAASR